MTIESLFHSVPQGWELISLGEICKRSGGNIQTGPFGSQLHAADYVEEGVPSIMPENIGDNQIITTDIARIKPEDAERLSRYIVRNGDIIYSRRGDITRRALIQEKQVGWLCGTGCLRIRLGEDVLDPYFAFYYLGHPKVRNWIALHAVGATMPNLNTSILSNLPFLLPPLEEQKSVTRVCQLLDRKISNLRQQNETLEKIAQTLFKHWFVDFEFPNEDGKPYKSSGGEMVRSELGEIPVGWRVGKLKDLVIVNPQESIKKGSFIKYIDMRSLSTSGMEITEFITREFTSGSKFRNSDTLLARITPCLENGKTAFVNVLDKNEVAYGSTEFIVMRASSICCPEYVYCLARSSFFRDYAIKNMTGSSGRQRVPNDRVENYEVEIPATEITQAFHEICNSFFLRIKSNQRQIQTLTQTRDRLLPKLMSGQLRITD
jgi:type I restriction enzyme, S subunit